MPFEKHIQGYQTQMYKFVSNKRMEHHSLGKELRKNILNSDIEPCIVCVELEFCAEVV